MVLLNPMAWSSLSPLVESKKTSECLRRVLIPFFFFFFPIRQVLGREL